MAVVAALAAASQGAAQTHVPPDPATVTLPDMTPTRDPEVIRNGWRFFYFHKAGVSYAQAHADFADCYRFLPAGDLANALPMFRPWASEVTPGPEPQPRSLGYGLVGDAILALVSGP